MTLRLRVRIAAAAAALVLAACGGGDDGPRYSRLVSFGDSLSDVGTHATPGVVALGGGKYTVNGPNSPIWIERLAASLGVAAPCPAQTGLEASGPLAALAAPIVSHPGCFDYAQGGARVTDPVGPYNKALLQAGDPSGYVGQLTVPVRVQMQRHLAAAGGRYGGDELVTVLAGGNDAFMNLVAVARGAAPATAVAAMATAGGELADDVKTLVLANGATRVAVVTLPDASLTPAFAGSTAQDVQARALVLQMVTAFNGALVAGLQNSAGVLPIDGFARSQSQASDPRVTNATTPACSGAAQLNALSCNASTLVAADVSGYLYSDTVHPSPLGYQLIAEFVTAELQRAGWL